MRTSKSPLWLLYGPGGGGVPQSRDDGTEPRKEIIIRGDPRDGKRNRAGPRSGRPRLRGLHDGVGDVGGGEQGVTGGLNGAGGALAAALLALQQHQLGALPRVTCSSQARREKPP